LVTLTQHPLWPFMAALQVPLVPELKLHLLEPDSAAWRWSDPDALGWPYWAFAWPGGQALARAVLDRPALVRGRRVVSFGCGGGIEAIAAAKAGASHVLASDLDPLAVELAHHNAALNGVSLTTTMADLIGAQLACEVLLLGDACYDDALADRLVPWLTRLRDDGVVVLLGDPSRVELRARATFEVVSTVLAPFDGDPRGDAARWATEVLRLR
jgi:predicted nicotinamide N-methyase